MRRRAVSQTFSKLTAGIPSTSFFSSSQSPQESLQSNQGGSAISANLQPATTQTTSSSIISPSTLFNVSTSRSSKLSSTPTGSIEPSSFSAHQPASAPVNISSAPDSHFPTANNSAVLAGSVPASHSSQGSNQKATISAAESNNSHKPTPETTSAALINNTIPPNLIEAIIVVGAALTLIIGGIIFYCFSSYRKKNKLAASTSDGTRPSSSKTGRDRSGSNTSSASHRIPDWPIDKKTIKFKKKTESIISFGPGPEPEVFQYPRNVTNSKGDSGNYVPQREKSDFFERPWTSENQAYGHTHKQTEATSVVGEEISHIPISYEAKYPKSPVISSTQLPLFAENFQENSMIEKEIAQEKEGAQKYKTVHTVVSAVTAKAVMRAGVGKRFDRYSPSYGASESDFSVFQPNVEPSYSVNKIKSLSPHKKFHKNYH